MKWAMLSCDFVSTLHYLFYKCEITELEIRLAIMIVLVGVDVVGETEEFAFRLVTAKQVHVNWEKQQ